MAKAPWSVADFSVTVPDCWNIPHGQFLSTTTDGGDEMGLAAFVPDHVWAEACAGSESGILHVGPTVNNLAAALDTQEDSVAQ